jgi:hypothetical protein
MLEMELAIVEIELRGHYIERAKEGAKGTGRDWVVIHTPSRRPRYYIVQDSYTAYPKDDERWATVALVDSTGQVSANHPKREHYYHYQV